MKRTAAHILVLSLLAACSKPAENPAPAAAAPAASAEKPTVSILAPAGTYTLDPYHSSLSFSLMHVGLAPYVARFTKTEATLELDPAKLAASKLSATIDPASVRTDFSGDYKATHEDSPYNSFEEALTKDAKFFNALEFPQITFETTAVEVSGKDRLKVTGNLTFLGQTRPVTLDVAMTGSMAQHPWTKAGAVGFSATGTFSRAAFGMDQMAGALGDAITIQFNGEFHQKVAPAEPPAG